MLNDTIEVTPVAVTPVVADLPLPVVDLSLPVVADLPVEPKAKKKRTPKPAVVAVVETIVEPTIVEPKAKKRTPKPVAPKRGRPPIYTGQTLQFVSAVMIAVNKKFAGQGVSKTGAMLTLTGPERTAKAKEFGIDLRTIADKVYGKKHVPDMTVSGVTLVKIGKALSAKGKITLSRGRPKLVAAE